MSKRTLDHFFKSPTAKKPKVEDPIVLSNGNSNTITTTLADSKPDPETPIETHEKPYKHDTYPWAIPPLPAHLAAGLEELKNAKGKVMNDELHLDLLYFQPFIPRSLERDLFLYLRQELFFYRVKYKIKRGGIETDINTPRYTTVFGLDETSQFKPDANVIVEARDTSKPVSKTKYRCAPRPLPPCLNTLRRVTEAVTNSTYNFCLVNYYATGSDSISYHSDDERFLGKDPAIASFSLGAKRDFLMKHKPLASDQPVPKQLKLPLASGDMILMRGTTQSNWLHSIPKRKGGESENGRINITFRKAMVPGGTENYYQYNVGVGQAHRWDKGKKEMVVLGPNIAAGV